MILEPGLALGRYRLVQRVGAGGMAEVWDAIDEKLSRHVALKVMAPSGIVDTGFVKRFLREATLTAQLEHPNILPVYDFGDFENVLFLVMPLMTGGTLRDRARKGSDWDTAIGWLRDLASALDYAHSQGVIHRDVKPANVLFDRGDRVMLADFGLAKPLNQEGMTVAGTVMGTPVYMSPEQVRGEAVSPVSDQYSLGVLAYYLVAGKPPFEANSTLVVMSKTLFEEPGLPSLVKPGLHRSVDYVLLKVLEKRPEDRFPSCGQFVSALQRALASVRP
ncbi:MAG: serine/threonine protein kinase [Acidobacteria bacterium]|nr:serine/threonine protein kinase [Acidobacteriota bacterium]MCG3193637.1 Serine/threonine-protein kinase PknB [Thermoanaerobaculia bacterium]MCK6683464.1 serine/threonine protein kinase [Thermoanaerobaculia bacterium]